MTVAEQAAHNTYLDLWCTYRGEVYYYAPIFGVHIQARCITTRTRGLHAAMYDERGVFLIAPVRLLAKT